MDFETAMHAAWAFVFGESCQLVVCSFILNKHFEEELRNLDLLPKKLTEDIETKHEDW